MKKIYDYRHVVCDECGWRVEKVQYDKTDEPGIVMGAPDDWEFLGWQDDDESGKDSSAVFLCPECSDVLL